ncbi:MAG: D-alanyl-D-alanine carboxypeptidase [Clostridia bacterium]|nr:D-alanyl-D-alanine carboxypeptidase [Clostridia bacterium]
MLKKSFISTLLVFILCFTFIIQVSALEIKQVNFELTSKSAILMDVNTGTILYEKDAVKPLHIASVTKIMTILLAFEAIKSGKINLEENVTISETAASMGGSQVYLEVGEELSVNELLKCIIIASANDAAVALAEHVSGSVETFVVEMNKRAGELGMKNTNFTNVTGLDDTATNHYSSALDVALMSRELLKHDKITEYTTIWMDTIRNGEFGLTNTNKLIRYYKGITGLKTGSTDKAGFCLSASAKREGLHLVAVVLGAESPTIRTQEVTKLLDFGFANYSIVKLNSENFGKMTVYGGCEEYVSIKSVENEVLINKGYENKITKEIILSEHLNAPIQNNEVVGKIVYKIDGNILCEVEILSTNEVERITFFEYLVKVIKNFF